MPRHPGSPPRAHTHQNDAVVEEPTEDALQPGLVGVLDPQDRLDTG